MLDVQIAPNPALRRILERHPRVSSVQERGGAPLEWVQDGHWSRRIWVGRTDVEPRGLIELMDNNPLVCADEMSVPSPAATLALIALGPLARAGILTDKPKIAFNFAAERSDIEIFLHSMGWFSECLVQSGKEVSGDICRCDALAPISPDPEYLADLYEEAFGRSFFVQREGSHCEAITPGSARARYYLQDTPSKGVMWIRVRARSEGKCGAAQIAHAFNVMCGFEESLGLSA